jgi:hypothetical protein
MEDEEGMQNTIYTLNEFEFSLEQETIKAMINLREKEKNMNYSDRDVSLESLEIDLNFEERPSFPVRIQRRGMK